MSISRELAPMQPELSDEVDLHVFSQGEVMAMAESGYTLIPLVERLEQTQTAGALYEKLRGSGPSFLLESAGTDERQGRYSFIGVDPEKIIRLEKAGMFVNGIEQPFDDPYEFVNKQITGHSVAPVADLPPYFGGAAGLFGYDLARYREPSVGQAKEDALDLPEMAVIVPRITIAVDHYKQEVSLIRNLIVEQADDASALGDKYTCAVSELAAMKQCVAELPTSGTQKSYYKNLEFSPNFTKEDFKQVVADAKEYCHAGDVFQVVPSQRFESDTPVDRHFAHEVNKKLKRLNPSRYAFLFEFGDFQVTGSSPETLVKVTNGQVEHMAIAGTRKRGDTPEADKELAQDLQNDPKERAEHSMLVDLSRNDVSRVCEPGSVEVAVHAEVENYSHVMHMTSKINGKLQLGKTAMDALASISPAGTLSGAPKIRAMQIIDELEPDKRGFYGGAVGYLGFNGDLDSCIFIRSILVDKGGYVHVQAGAGVVADSIPESEYEETMIKVAAPIRAIEAVCNSQSSSQKLRTTEHRMEPIESKIAKRIGKKVVLLDNYDSYTYNLSHYLAMLGAEVEVFRNDVAPRELINAKPDFVFVSPGPRGPEEAGLSMQAMRYFPEKGIPSLGVCLGHQALVKVFGGEVVRHKPVHGKTSKVTHDGKTIFGGLPNPLTVMRYHSLVANIALPPELELSAAIIEDGMRIPMAVRHRKLPAEGVQFHPESIYTASGMTILKNFLNYRRQYES